MGPGQISSAGLEVDGLPFSMRLCSGKEGSLAGSTHRLCIVSKPVAPEPGSPRTGTVVELWQKHWVIVQFRKVRDCMFKRIGRLRQQVTGLQGEDKSPLAGRLTQEATACCPEKHSVAYQVALRDAMWSVPQDRGGAAEVMVTPSNFGAVRGAHAAACTQLMSS